jgi:tRNA G18 (ribose-2'-O)-methylase SpoU
MRKLKNIELNRISVNEFKTLEKLPVVIVLDNLRSLNNIGSIFRTADSFRIEKIHLCGITATPPHREINKTALGATESVEWVYFPKVVDSVNLLKENGYTIVAVEQMDDSITLENFKPAAYDKLALIFGNEINGVSDNVVDCLDACVEIPQFGTKHSFNVAVSVGILLWHLYLNHITK